jgi:hypothetical protein
MTATTSPPLPDPSPSPADLPRDTLGHFLEDLDGFLRRWRDRTGGHWIETIRFSFIDEEPIEGCARQRRGPQAKVLLTITDMARADELAAAYYWVGMDRRPVDRPAGSCELPAIADEVRDDPLAVGAERGISEIDHHREAV